VHRQIQRCSLDSPQKISIIIIIIGSFGDWTQGLVLSRQAL
jgi:hypothetical protein